MITSLNGIRLLLWIARVIRACSVGSNGPWGCAFVGAWLAAPEPMVLLHALLSLLLRTGEDLEDVWLACCTLQSWAVGGLLVVHV